MQISLSVLGMRTSMYLRAQPWGGVGYHKMGHLKIEEKGVVEGTETPNYCHNPTPRPTCLDRIYV